MAIKCENQSFKVHKCAFEKDGFKKYGAWTGFKNKAGEWHDVYVSLLFTGDRSNIDLTPQSRIKVTGGMSHYKDAKADGTFFEGWSVFVEDCEIVQMGGEQGSKRSSSADHDYPRKPMTEMDEPPF